MTGKCLILDAGFEFHLMIHEYHIMHTFRKREESLAYYLRSLCLSLVNTVVSAIMSRKISRTCLCVRDLFITCHILGRIILCQTGMRVPKKIAHQDGRLRPL